MSIDYYLLVAVFLCINNRTKVVSVKNVYCAVDNVREKFYRYYLFVKNKSDKRTSLFIYH